jgi:hypothetical protein
VDPFRFLLSLLGVKVHQDVEAEMSANRHQEHRFEKFEEGEAARRAGKPCVSPYKALSGPGVDFRALWIRGWKFEDGRIEEEERMRQELEADLERVR